MTERLDDRKLVATHPRNRVGLTHIVTQSLRNGHEKAISDLVSTGVVDLLEAIKVQAQNCESLPRRSGRRDRFPQAVLKHQAVRQLGQVVVVSSETQTLLGHFLEQRRPDRISERRDISHHRVQFGILRGEGERDTEALLLHPNWHTHVLSEHVSSRIAKSFDSLELG